MLKIDPFLPTREPPLWVRASVDDAAFAQEQACFAKNWGLVGMAGDIPNDNDWFRTTLGLRSIFVQRFGTEIRAFENRCAHRFYPLRTEDKGNGQVLCAFHHWRYNKEGVALGIPKCPEVYGGRIPRDMDARLTQLDVALCGDMIFARFPSSEPGESLEEFLGEAWPILAALGTPDTKPIRYVQKVKSYWKFSHHISLDDYHIVAVHPSTFGKDGYLTEDLVNYTRFGRSSAFLTTKIPDAMTSMAKACADGTHQPDYYAIFNMFPNTLVSQFEATTLFGERHWYVSVLRYLPVARNATEVHVWLYKAPFAMPQTAMGRFARPVTNLVVPPIVAYYARKVMNEDNAIVEGQTALAPQVEGDQILSAHEARIGWYEKEYAAMLGRPEEAPAQAMGEYPPKTAIKPEG